MAKRSRRGYRAPANYEPNRKRGAEYKRRFHGEPREGRQEKPSGDQPPPNQERIDRGARERQQSPDPRPARAPEIAPERLEAKRTTAADVAGMSFADLGLGGNIIRTLGELGAEAPFPVQAATIPDALEGRDVLGRARTGSGKTIAFGAALVERLLQLKAQGAFASDPAREKRPRRGERGARVPRKVRNPKALILAPTRELALQIDATVQPIARSVGLYTAQLVGGVPIDPQLHALERGIDIVIGTPGRMQDLVNRRKLDLREVVVSVVDEADHMCDLGFLEPVQRLLRQTVRGGQRLLFSATLDQAVSELVGEFLRNPAVHEIAEDTSSSATTEHRVYIVLREHKLQVLEELVRSAGRAPSQGRKSSLARTMVFCRTRAYATSLAEALVDAGIAAVPLHGDLSQSKRERNLARFASGKAGVLVATDVAARGIHVDDVDLVLQADPPDDHKTYLHRAGRTGRAGKAGLVITVIPRTRQKRTRELFELAQIEPSCFEDYLPQVN
ncbi:DEAD/DEAH box helicase [Leucobacter sp. GX24907]